MSPFVLPLRSIQPVNLLFIFRFINLLQLEKCKLPVLEKSDIFQPDISHCKPTYAGKKFKEKEDDKN